VVPTSNAGTPAPIIRFEDFFAPFHEAEKGEERFSVGAEMEKPAVLSGVSGSFEPIPYDGERSVAKILGALQTSGWSPVRETDEGPVIALYRGQASVTLEPGGQLELSGAPHPDVHGVDAELRAHQAELDPICAALGIDLLGIGFHPFAKRDELPWVPKKRYAIMKRYLPTRGGRALDMMQRTSTVQANLDYSSERDAMRKMRVMLAIAPLVTAMFANSPFKEGAKTGGLSERGAVWLDVDPDRTGLVPSLFKRNAGYVDYVEWALDVPMFLVKRGDEYLENTGQTFRQFWKQGRDGHHATQSDWRLHLNTLFPEVRLKHTIELRSADAQSIELAPALSALAVGLLYEGQALGELEQVVMDFTHDEVARLRKEVWKTGLRAKFRGAPLISVAERVLTIAEGGLRRRAIKDATGVDETKYLAPLSRLVASGKTPAEALLEKLGPGDFRGRVVELTKLG
jgi:glutamate--cysteine ligase